MAKNTEPAFDLDDLLSVVPDAEPVVEDVPEEESETSERRRIRELTEVLAQKPETEEFIPSGQLTADQLRIRELEDQLARRIAEQAEAAPSRYDTAKADGDTILIHFLADGFTAAGVIWYRGQEVEFVIGSEAHKQQLDRFGKSWLDLADDPAAQYRKWGQQFFARGSWPGRAWGDTSNLSPEEATAAAAAAEAERRRGRKAPLIG